MKNLFVRANKEDKDKFISDLYLGNVKKLIRYAYRETGDRELAADLVNRTAQVLLNRIDHVMKHPDPAGWLFETLKNICRKELARSIYKIEISLEEIMDISGLAHDSGTSGTLFELLPTGLTEHEREILIWRYEQQLSYEEMTNLLGITETACRQRVSRAVKHCGELLEKF